MNKLARWKGVYMFVYFLVFLIAKIKWWRGDVVGELEVCVSSKKL